MFRDKFSHVANLGAAASAGETDEERGAAANCAQAGGGAFADTKEQVKLDRDDLDFSFAVEVHYH